MRNVGVAPPGHGVLPLQVWRRDCSDILKVCHPRSTRTTDRLAQGEGEPLTELRAWDVTTSVARPVWRCVHTPRGVTSVPELVRPPFHSLVDGGGGREGERVLFFSKFLGSRGTGPVRFSVLRTAWNQAPGTPGRVGSWAGPEGVWSRGWRAACTPACGNRVMLASGKDSSYFLPQSMAFLSLL